MTRQPVNPVRTKSFTFAVRISEFCTRHYASPHRPLIIQLLRSGTSIGANIEESLAAQSKRDFLTKMSIACKEARESLYWLKLFRAMNIGRPYEVEKLIHASEELVRILTSITMTLKHKTQSS